MWLQYGSSGLWSSWWGIARINAHVRYMNSFMYVSVVGSILDFHGRVLLVVAVCLAWFKWDVVSLSCVAAFAWLREVVVVWWMAWKRPHSACWHVSGRCGVGSQRSRLCLYSMAVCAGWWFACYACFASVVFWECKIGSFFCWFSPCCYCLCLFMLMKFLFKCR